MNKANSLTQDILRKPVSSLNLSVRTLNCLYSEDIYNSQDLLKINPQTLLKVKNFGKKCLTEVNMAQRQLCEKQREGIHGVKDESSEDLSLISIERLGLSIRSYNCLKTNQIQTLEDILKINPNRFMKIQNFGKKSLKEILAIRQEHKKHFEENKISRVQDFCKTQSSLKNTFVSFLDELHFEDRTKSILLDRLFTKKTLQDIADNIGMTRERVRQIEKASLKKVLGSELPYIVTKANVQLQEKHIIKEAAIKSIFTKDFGWEADFNGEDKIILELLLSSSDLDVRYEEGEQGFYFLISKFNRNRDLESCMLRVLKNNKTMGVDKFFKSVNGIYLNGEISKEHVIDYLTVFSKNMQVFIKGDTVILNKMEGVKTLEAALPITLEEEGKPLHFSIIAKRLQKHPFFKNTATRTIHNALIWNSKIEYVDRGTYALKNWNIKRKLTYTEQIEDILSSEKRPMRFSRIANKMARRGYEKETNIHASLTQNPKKFIKTGHSTYVLKKHYNKGLSNHKQSKEGLALLKNLIGVN